MIETVIVTATGIGITVVEMITEGLQIDATTAVGVNTEVVTVLNGTEVEKAIGTIEVGIEIMVAHKAVVSVVKAVVLGALLVVGGIHLAWDPQGT